MAQMNHYRSGTAQLYCYSSWSEWVFNPINFSVVFILQAFFKQNNVPQESRFNLKKNVEEEYRKWKSMTNENDIITHFSMQGSPPLFLCLLWKMLLETDHINQIGFRCETHAVCREHLICPLRRSAHAFIRKRILFTLFALYSAVFIRELD